MVVQNACCGMKHQIVNYYVCLTIFYYRNVPTICIHEQYWQVIY